MGGRAGRGREPLPGDRLDLVGLDRDVVVLAVSRDLRDRLKELAARERRQLRAVVEEALLAILDRAEQARKGHGK